MVRVVFGLRAVRILGVWLVLTAASGSPATSQEDDVRAAANLCWEENRSGPAGDHRCQDAVRALKAIVAVQPRNLAARYELARAFGSTLWDLADRSPAAVERHAELASHLEAFLELAGDGGPHEWRRKAADALLQEYEWRSPGGVAGWALAAGRRRLALDPADPSVMQRVGQMYAHHGLADDAEALLENAFVTSGRSLETCAALARFYGLRLWGGKDRFEEGLKQLEACAASRTGEAAAPLSLATTFWDKAYRDAALNDSERIAYADRGLAAVDRALALVEDARALTLKGLLLRVKSNASKSPLREQYLKEAEEYTRRSMEALRKRR